MLAYQSVSCRFRTFLLDCELDRVECGITAVEDKRGSLTSHHKNVDTGSDDECIYPGIIFWYFSLKNLNLKVKNVQLMISFCFI